MTGRFHHGFKTFASDANAGHRRDTARRAAFGSGAFGALSALLVILLFAASASPARAAPASPNITLEIHNHASSGSDGYTNTTASNGATYSYRYSGGESNGGDVIFRTRGRVNVNVRLAKGSSYTIGNVTFEDDAHDQLRWLSGQHATSTAVIQDKNDAVQTARYKITVHDEGTGASIPCDPIIANRG